MDGPNLVGCDIAGLDDGVDIALAHPAGDQLFILPAKVKNQYNLLCSHGVLRNQTILTYSSRPAPTETYSMRQTTACSRVLI